MKEFVIEMLSQDNNEVDYTTRLSVVADTANKAVIKAMNWLTDKNLEIVEIRDIWESN